jgi:hypothetical protein
MVTQRKVGEDETDQFEYHQQYNYKQIVKIAIFLHLNTNNKKRRAQKNNNKKNQHNSLQFHH